VVVVVGEAKVFELGRFCLFQTRAIISKIIVHIITINIEYKRLIIAITANIIIVTIIAITTTTIQKTKMTGGVGGGVRGAGELGETSVDEVVGGGGVGAGGRGGGRGRGGVAGRLLEVGGVGEAEGVPEDGLELLCLDPHLETSTRAWSHAQR